MAAPDDIDTEKLLAELNAEFGKKRNPRAALDTFTWQQRPDAEVARLTKLLQQHLSKHGVSARERTHAKAQELLRKILEEQQGTCFFAGGDDRYCWNHPKDSDLAFLKLEWGHLVPRAQRTGQTPLKMVLLCARCNNHLQTSRTIEQLIPELEHKLAVLKRWRLTAGS
jgi:hypothetical protein